MMKKKIFNTTVLGGLDVVSEKANLIDEINSGLAGVDGENVWQLHVGEQGQPVVSDANLLLQRFCYLHLRNCVKIRSGGPCYTYFYFREP